MRHLDIIMSDAMMSTMRTTLRIDDDLLRELRERAAASRVSLARYVNEVLRRGLDAPEPETPAPIEQPTFAMGPARVDLTKALSIADALEDEEVSRKSAERR
jgi:hypothetical protein